MTESDELSASVCSGRITAAEGESNFLSPSGDDKYIAVRRTKSECVEHHSNVSLEMIGSGEIYSHFMKNHTCFDMMAISGRVLVLDSRLLVKKAFFALVFNNVRAALVFDSEIKCFTGILTISDFIKLLELYYNDKYEKIKELEFHSIKSWKEQLKDSSKKLIYLTSDTSLYDAVKLLITHRIHRLPVIDPATGDFLHLVTHKRILRFLFLHIYDIPKPLFVEKTLADLSLGVSALPIVGDDSKLQDVFSRFDVINLAASGTYNDLDRPVREALPTKAARLENVCCCYENESLSTAMSRIVTQQVHRLIVINENKQISGILSLSDILDFIVLKQN